MEQLQAQVEQLTQEIATERARGNFSEADRKSEELGRLQAQLDDLKRNKLVSTITAEVNEPESTFVIAAGGFSADFRALTKGEDEYQMAYITTKLYLANLEADHAKEIDAITEAHANMSKLIEDELEQTRRDLADVRGKLEIANNIIKDLEIERDIAVKEAETLRKQITEKPKVDTNLDTGTKLAEINARLEAKKIPVYNVRAGDLKTSFYLAQLASTGEEIEIRPYYDLKSKYRQVDDGEAARFRQEREREEAIERELESNQEIAATVSSDVEVTIMPPTFQVPDAYHAGGLDRDEPVPEGGSNHDGGETFENEVRRRLADIETTIYGQVKKAS